MQPMIDPLGPAVPRTIYVDIAWDRFHGQTGLERRCLRAERRAAGGRGGRRRGAAGDAQREDTRSEEHKSELQSRPHLLSRLLPAKKKNHDRTRHSTRITTRT